MEIRLLTSANFWGLAFRCFAEETDIVVLPITLLDCIPTKFYFKKATVKDLGYLLQEVASSFVA